MIRLPRFILSASCFIFLFANATPGLSGGPKNRFTKFRVSKKTFVRDVQRLLAYASTGKRQLVELKLSSTVGWGCPCPDFAHARAHDLDLTDHEEAYLKVVSAKGVSNIQNFVFAGTYRVRGYYTGKAAARNRRERILLRRKKQLNTGYEFIATEWCYYAPKNYDPSECYLYGAEKPGMRWCGAPIKEPCRTLE